jgi:hypothetical protein
MDPKYVPLYVRSTLFETNGTSPGGDQTYASMAKDRTYSYQLGRSMAALAPLKQKKVRVQKESEEEERRKREEEEAKRRAKIRLK